MLQGDSVPILGELGGSSKSSLSARFCPDELGPAAGHCGSLRVTGKACGSLWVTAGHWDDLGLVIVRASSLGLETLGCFMRSSVWRPVLSEPILCLKDCCEK